MPDRLRWSWSVPLRFFGRHDERGVLAGIAKTLLRCLKLHHPRFGRSVFPGAFSKIGFHCIEADA
jgi:hypothetical protein